MRALRTKSLNANALKRVDNFLSFVSDLTPRSCSIVIVVVRLNSSRINRRFCPFLFKSFVPNSQSYKYRRRGTFPTFSYQPETIWFCILYISNFKSRKKNCSYRHIVFANTLRLSLSPKTIFVKTLHQRIKSRYFEIDPKQGCIH